MAHRALGALLHAWAAAILVAVVHAWSIASSTPAAAITSATLAWWLPATVLGFAGLAFRVLLERSRLVRAWVLPPPDEAPRRTAQLLAALAGALFVLVGLHMFVTYSVRTQRIAAALLGFGAIVVAFGTHAPLTRLLGRLPRPRHATWFATLVLALMLGSILAAWVVFPEYVRVLPWRLALASSFVLGSACVGAGSGRIAMAGGVVVLGALTCVLGASGADASPRGPWVPTKAPAPAESELRVVACREDQRLTSPAELSAPQDAPDIVLVTVDGWRWDHTSMADLGFDVTPNLARRARDAAMFTRAYTAAPSTRHAFRSLFTGIWPGRIPAPPTPGHRWALSIVDGQPTLASYLSALGYRTTALISKSEIFPPQFGGLAGFDVVDDSFHDFQLEHRYSASLKVGRIIDELAEPPGTREPRFVWAHLIEPHFPFTFGPELPSDDSLGYHDRHLHSVRYVDQQLERLASFLAGPERRERTLVILSADHGEAFNEHGFFRHGQSVYEEEIHVPLIVWGPGVVPGRRRVPVSHVDVLPTVLGMLGIEHRGSCGQSLVDSLRTGAEPAARAIYSAALPDQQTDYFHLAWIDGDRKTIVDATTGEARTFDLARDIGEHDGRDAEARELDALREFLRAHDQDPEAFAL